MNRSIQVLLSGLALALAGCGLADELLDVETPSRVLDDKLKNPAVAGLLVQSAVADFECAFAGYIVATGLHGDELADGQQLRALYRALDRRALSEDGGDVTVWTCNDAGPLPGIYTAMQTARFQADETARALEAWTDGQVTGRQTLLATAYAYAGYAVLLLAESYCSLAIDIGPELTRAQGFAEAESRFSSALAAAEAGGATEIKNMALVGRARARLNQAVVEGNVVDQSKLDAAAADAEQVPPGFVKYATYATTPDRRNNIVFNANNVAQTSTVQTPFRNATDLGEPDPRVPVVNTGQLAQDGFAPLWIQQKYPSLDASIPIARWAEAQLILAEARGGAVAVDVINALHAAASLPPFAGGSPAEIRQHLIGERERELFLEGQHLGDKLRYGTPFNPPAGTPYPGGGTYGSTTCLPLPLKERNNNPNL